MRAARGHLAIAWGCISVAFDLYGADWRGERRPRKSPASAAIIERADDKTGSEAMVNVSFLQELLNGIAERGRTLLPRALVGAAPDTRLAPCPGPSLGCIP